MLYYKLIENPKVVGTIINTEDNFDFKRIERFSSLKHLLKLLFEVSYSNNIPLHYILSQIYPNVFRPEIAIRNEQKLLNDIEKVRKEMNRTNFDIFSEFKYFNDFILDMIRSDLANSNILLPDRFKSHFFFETIEECIQYHNELLNCRPCKLVEVELIDKKQIIKLDNRLLTTFENSHTSNDFYNQAKECLIGNVTENPLYEIVFQGKYQIKYHLLDL
ncbi:MAG: hypothetical protein IPO21_05125 [Bacteroidales bacterium]|nr:hypothetical protein [Bacteroidales bacterium]